MKKSRLEQIIREEIEKIYDLKEGVFPLYESLKETLGSDILLEDLVNVMEESDAKKYLTLIQEHRKLIKK